MWEQGNNHNVSLYRSYDNYAKQMHQLNINQSSNSNKSDTVHSLTTKKLNKSK